MLCDASASSPMAYREEPAAPSSPASLLMNLGQTLTHIQSGVTKKRKAGRKKFRETRHPVYKGVRQRNGKWVCEMRQPGLKKSRVWLGTFTCPEMAARAYDVAALALKGESAQLNFPDEAKASPSWTSSMSLPELTSMVNLEKVEVGSSKGYVDEEELFNMPEILDSMAEGLILTPPALKKGFNWDDYDLENAVEFSLWSD
uniref:Putative CBF/DREB transcription factor n=1 Tax=Rosa chinensis TaxID=74649 RepID=A5JV33_ROSCH|nr:putative CBF/DREB transcription factor [Rosa chinensis]